METVQCVQEHSPQNVTQLNAKYGNKFREFTAGFQNFPDNMDWRTSGAVGKVKDQVQSLSIPLAIFGLLNIPAVVS